MRVIDNGNLQKELDSSMHYKPPVAVAVADDGPVAAAVAFLRSLTVTGE